MNGFEDVTLDMLLNGGSEGLVPALSLQKCNIEDRPGLNYIHLFFRFGTNLCVRAAS